MNNVFKRILRWRNKSVSKGQLARLNDRMLDDIGIARSDVGQVIAYLG